MKSRMTREEALEILRKHQEWRRYRGPIGEGPKMVEPAEVGKAIDVAIGILAEDKED